MLNIVEWHDRSQANHKQQLEKWADLGFRTISLSVYHTPADPLYACVMLKRDKLVDEQQFSGLDAAGLQQTVTLMALQGKGAHIVTATGPKDSAVFAVSFIPVVFPLPPRFGMTPKQFADANADARSKGLRLAWFDCYGTPAQEVYIAAWWPNPERLAWNCDGIGETIGAASSRLMGLRSTWARAAQVVMTPSGAITVLYTDGSVGEWHVRQGQTSAGYQQFLDEQKNHGLVPLAVSATGEGPAASFGLVFAQREETSHRKFRSQGPTASEAVDKVMSDYLRDHGIRNAALAIVKGSRLVHAQGYTWAQTNYPDVQPTTLFRLGSCSKIFGAYAVYSLLQDAIDKQPAGSKASFKDQMKTIKLQSVLKLRQPKGQPPADPSFADITLLDLITSTSGLEQHAVFRCVDAAAAFGEPLPATRMQLASFATQFSLTSKPGDPHNVRYGNLDYFLIGEIVRVLGNAETFEEVLRTRVLKPLGIAQDDPTVDHVRASRSMVWQQAPDEAFYHLTQPNSEGELTVSPSVCSQWSQLEPTQYGGAALYGGLDVALYSCSGGLSASVVGMARMIASLDAGAANPVLHPATRDQWLQNAADATSTLTGPAAHGYHGWDNMTAPPKSPSFTGRKGGDLPGVASGVVFTAGKTSYIIVMGTKPRSDVTTDWLKPLKALPEPSDWATLDLFPKFQMPSFKA